MGGIYECGCKEVYRLPHITYPYSSCICSFLQQYPYFLLIFLMFFVLVPVLFVMKKALKCKPSAQFDRNVACIK